MRAMNLAPLLAAPAVIQVHAFAALSAFALGAVQLAAPKGTIPHRAVGWLWAGLMLVLVLSSFFIHTIRLWGPFSPIHLLSIFTLAMLSRCGGHGSTMCASISARCWACSWARWSSLGSSRSCPAASCTPSCSAPEPRHGTADRLPRGACFGSIGR
jgi:uncharacterized membrane protein